VPKIARRLRTLHDVGLDYHPPRPGGDDALRRLRPSGSSWRPSLSKVATGSTLYILDEPPPAAFRRRAAPARGARPPRRRRQSVVVIEHNLDVIKTADHLIDLGPEGGRRGGRGGRPPVPRRRSPRWRAPTTAASSPSWSQPAKPKRRSGKRREPIAA